MKTPRYNDEHNERAHTLITAVRKAINPQQSVYVYIDDTGDIFWGGDYSGSAQDRQALAHWLDVVRKDIKDYQRKHDSLAAITARLHER